MTRATLTEQARRLNWASGRIDLPALIVMSDEQRLPDPVVALAHLPPGGAIVLRHRDAVARRALVERTMPLAHARGVLVIVADDPELAHRSGAAGLHLPERVAASADAYLIRRRWRGLLTCAAHDPRALRRAHQINADAALVSPVFPTRSHPGDVSIGLMRFLAWTRDARLPVYALGGVNAANAGRLHGRTIVGIAGIDGFI